MRKNCSQNVKNNCHLKEYSVLYLWSCSFLYVGSLYIFLQIFSKISFGMLSSYMDKQKPRYFRESSRMVQDNGRLRSHSIQGSGIVWVLVYHTMSNAIHAHTMRVYYDDWISNLFSKDNYKHFLMTLPSNDILSVIERNRVPEHFFPEVFDVLIYCKTLIDNQRCWIKWMNHHIKVVTRINSWTKYFSVDFLV